MDDISGTPTAPFTEQLTQPVTPPQSEKPKSKANIISVVLLILILLAVPITVIYLGNQTRQEIKAANECKTPAIPDPADCPGGTWKLYKDVNSCIHFRCTPQ